MDCELLKIKIDYALKMAEKTKEDEYFREHFEDAHQIIVQQESSFSVDAALFILIIEVVGLIVAHKYGVF